MKLIGELFKIKMLTAHIMHDCVVKLLKDEHEESLECLCKLMSTVGKDLDTPNAKVHTHIFTQISDSHVTFTQGFISFVFSSPTWTNILPTLTRLSRGKTYQPGPASCC